MIIQKEYKLVKENFNHRKMWTTLKTSSPTGDIIVSDGTDYYSVFGHPVNRGESWNPRGGYTLVAKTRTTDEWTDRWQVKMPTGTLEAFADLKSTSPEGRAVERQLLQRTLAAMERLPPKQRIALALHDLEEMGVTEIGKLLDTSPQTVWARVQTARERVKKHLQRTGKVSTEDAS